MLVRRLSVGTLSFLAVLGMMSSRVSPETGDKQLLRVKGIVGYQQSDPGEFKAIFGRLDLPDDAYAVTRPNGQAVLRVKDSSEIDIGENTKVQVGAFNEVSSGQQNSITLLNGALHFAIRHVQGAQSNYRFSTTTSQIAVRGTEGFLIAGPSGTQVVCVSCAVGDVTVQVGQQTVSLVTNETLTVLGSSPLTATTTITANPTVNNPAINQFNGNQNPFNPNPTGNTLDPTNSLSGTGTGTAGAGLGGTVVAAAGGAAVVGGVVAATSKGSNAITPPSAGQPGALVVQLSYPGANASFPIPFTWPFSQSNATGEASVTCSPPSVISCTVTQSLSGTTLNGAISGNLIAPGTFTVGASASGYTVPTTSFTVYGSVSPTVTALNFTSLTPQTVIVTQNPAGTILTTSYTCAPGAAMSVSPSSGPSPLHVTVTPVSSPTTPSTAAACTLTVTGSGGTAVSSVAIPVNITTTSIGISSHRRKPL
jgi:hypothetical protein